MHVHHYPCFKVELKHICEKLLYIERYRTTSYINAEVFLAAIINVLLAMVVDN